MGVFGPLAVRLDPWPIEYGAEVSAFSAPAPEEGTVDPNVEVGEGAWAPIEATAGAPAGPVFFVDGVRRLEARVVLEEGERRAYGAFGSYAVGAVEVLDGHARFAVLRPDRVVAGSGGLVLPRIVELGPALAYRPITVKEGDEDAPVRALHGEMRTGEARLAGELAEAAGALVIADGPLAFEDEREGDVVGYVKNIMQVYLQGGALRVLRSLPARTRTPLFSIQVQERFARLSWFIRLEAPRLGDAELSGVVRLEVPARVEKARAIALADATLRLIPLFSAIRGLHPRAPQNLLPIAALEGRLRREMGDARWMRRCIETLLAKEAMG